MTESKKFKSRDELEEEDHKRYREHQRETFKRRQEKLVAEGFCCSYEECSQSFDNPQDLKIHQEQHRQEYYAKMKCNQPKCGKQVNQSFYLCLFFLILHSLLVY